MSDNRLELQDFLKRLNRDPHPAELDNTPDGNAKTLPISFVEMTLDEIFVGLWSTENFKWAAITNEVQGSLDLVVIHPITGHQIRRTGAASIVITVDSLSKADKAEMTSQQRNLYALNPENKKPNALDLAFPKLKAECVKNAAQSIGKIFGRDLNRKKKDILKTEYKTLTDIGFTALVARVENGDIDAIKLARANFLLSEVQNEILDGMLTPQKKLGNG